jgi:RNA polymerase sigma-70 factor (ECF subfamily)
MDFPAGTGAGALSFWKLARLMSQSSPDPQGTSLTLLARVRANEADAWDRLVRLYSPLVRYWCLRGGLQDSDADDVVQEVCRSALVGLADFQRDRPGDTFRGWLRIITRNALALHFRRKGRQPLASGGSAAFDSLQELADPRVDLPDDDPPAELQGLYRRALELVRGEFEERTWQMFWLTVVDDRPPTDVAAQFGVTPVAVRKAKSRVLRRLREEIGDLIN